jgi:hypothetical protein
MGSKNRKQKRAFLNTSTISQEKADTIEKKNDTVPTVSNVSNRMKNMKSLLDKHR